jgi:hypothetical protein
MTPHKNMSAKGKYIYPDLRKPCRKKSLLKSTLLLIAIWIFSLTQSFWLLYGPGVDSASNRNEYQECFLGVKAAGA